jgi:hypothetical protein
MKIFFVGLLFLIPIYIWYRLILRFDQIFYNGRISNSILYTITGLGGIAIAVGLFFILTELL